MTDLAERWVMVVEDRFDLAMEAMAILETAGAAVIGPFATSADALTSLQQRTPDCALLDVNLGDSVSYDLARILRTRGIPFVFFTGYDHTALPAEFATVQRLEKPVNAASLVRAIETCCRSASPAN